MITRESENLVKVLLKEFKVVGIIGPRQSGKTTLAKKIFHNKPYISLESPDNRLFAESDPRSFLAQFPTGGIIDEIQNVPHLFSYLQERVDEAGIPGQFLITGSRNFSMLEKISQSLAGRIALLKLLPFSFNELDSAGYIAENSLNTILFKGGYPPIYDAPASPVRWLNAYINSYIERDVRQIVNVADLSQFQHFLKLCAGNIGQLLNMSRIGADCGINQGTVNAWLSILEASFIIYRLQPHHENFRKRLVKTPKLYFFDTALAIRLLGIETEDQLVTNTMRGNLFENWAISELLKHRFNIGMEPNIYFWRDNIGNEVDVIIENKGKLIPIEIKSGATIASNWFTSINNWCELAGAKATTPYLLFGGETSRIQHGVNVISWRNINESMGKA